LGKKSAILLVTIAFIIGFVTGSVVAILKRSQHVRTAADTEGARSPLNTAPLSIEDLEKIEDLKEDLHRDPRNLAAWRRLGKLYSNFNHLREAIEAYRQYLAINPGDADVRTEMGILLRKWGDFDGAAEELKRVAESDVKQINSRYLLGMVLLYDKRDIQGATRVWQEFLKLEPKGKRAEWVRGQLEQLRRGPEGEPSAKRE
jgi:cytochrome c-type biogenesis protein CcmH/NrfG